MVEELYFSEDGKSLRRGRRASKRREIERSVQIWRPGQEETPAVGIATDISLEGILLHTPEPFAVGDEVLVDVKRGKNLEADTFLFVRGEVRRSEKLKNGRYSLGIRMMAKERRQD